MHQFLSFRQRFAKFKSARLQAAVAGIAQGGASELMLEDQGGGKKKAKKGGGKRARGGHARKSGGKNASGELHWTTLAVPYAHGFPAS